MSALTPGWGNIGFQLGTGIHTGWDHANFWLKEHSEDELKWKETYHVCDICGKPLFRAEVPVPYFLTLWKCENGHKFSYQNTD
uniref:Uncharacterized protein n=1 Tax=viral metagenome TaxID=1070528 RepID=A0A6M3LYU1_9ZZZZ